MKQPRKNTALRGTLLALAALGGMLLPACGYTLQSSHSKELEKDGIRKIFIAPLVNNTYKSGVENIVYNALLRALASNRELLLVRQPEDADAILQGTVNAAQFGSSAGVRGSQLKGVTDKTIGRFQDIAVATEYTSSLDCSFNLNRRGIIPGKKALIWAGSFARSKPFPASNQLATLGETSALINESEFDRTLSEMAQSMMADVRESMLARF